MSHGGLFDMLEMMLICNRKQQEQIFIFVTYFHDQTGLNIQIGFYFQ